MLDNLNNVTFEPALPHGPPPVVEVGPEIECFKQDLIISGNGSYYAVPTCSSIFFKQSTHIVVRGLRVQSKVRWMSTWLARSFQLASGEISFANTENVVVEGVTARRGLCFIESNVVNVTMGRFGQIDNESHCVQVPDDVCYGIYIANTTNILLNNPTVSNVKYYGIYLQDTRYALLDRVVSLNPLYGPALSLTYTRNITVRNPVLEICSATYMPTIEVVASISAVIEGVSLLDRPAKILLKSSVDIKFLSLTIGNTESKHLHSVKVFMYTCANITFQNSSITDSALLEDATTDVVSLPAVLYVHFSVGITLRDSTFARNKQSVINARASDVILSGNVVFSNNSSPSGAVIIISKESNVTLEENCRVVFEGNRAVSSGGAIYIVTGEDVFEQVLKGRWCFLHVKGNRFHPQMWFSGNWAGKAGDVLYGGHLAIGYNGIEDNCLQSFWNASDISQQKSLSVVASESSRVCLCESELPNCLRVESTPYDIYPGQTISLSLVIVGQAFGSVSGSVFAHFIYHTPNDEMPLLISSQYTQVVGKESCNTLDYTVVTTTENGSSHAILALTPQFKATSYFLSKGSVTVRQALEKYGKWARMNPLKTPFPKNILEFPVYVNITLLPCPIGFDLRGEPGAKCECDPLIQGLNDVECDIGDQTISRSGLVWIGTDDRGEGSNDTLNTSKLISSKYCPLNYCKGEKVRMSVGEYDTQCNYDRSGMLCGECKEGLSLALGSSQCLSCSNKYIVLILPLLLAGVALVAFIKLVNLTIAHGTINGLVFYVNIVKANEFIFLPNAGANPLTIFIAWTNLDLGIETCFWDGLTAYSKAWVQFLFPLYIWAIAGGIVVLSKYSSKVAGLMGSNSVSVLATLFFLSYSKLLRIIIVGLSYTVLESSEGQTLVWSSDGNLEYLGPRHALLFTVCVAALVFVWLPYTLLLFCGQWLYKIECQPVMKLLGRITPFLDSHYAPLKGRHRYWFGAQLLIRATILIISSVIPADGSSTVVLSVSVAAVVLTAFSSVGFYQNKLVSIIEMSFFANLALLGVSAFFATNTGTDVTVPAYFLILLAFIQFLCLVGYQLSVRLRGTRVVLVLRGWVARKRGFRVMAEDEAEEMYEYEREEEVQREEEILRENGSKNGEQNGRIDASQTSGPTY